MEQQVVGVDTAAESASRQLKEATGTAPIKDAGDRNLHKKRVRSECNSHNEIKFVDVGIAATISNLEHGLNEFYNMELEYQGKLVRTQAISMLNENFIHNLQQLGNFKVK